jgi:monomeric sarcosine oxidase
MTWDVTVVGAGVFGAWTALALRRLGRRVLLVDAWGSGNSRASSGGETRVTRMGYGEVELYTKWSQKSLESWKELQVATRERLFVETGVLWLARDEDPLSASTLATLGKAGVIHERLGRDEIEKRWPQISFGRHPGASPRSRRRPRDSVTWAIHEPTSGVLMARRAVQAAARQAATEGADVRTASAVRPRGRGRLESVAFQDGSTASAAAFVFALGPWLGKLFPKLLGDRIFPTRQEVYYFGPPPGDVRFGAESLPAWVDFGAEIYGIPDLEGKGFKIAPDRHGPRFDPDSGERVTTPETLAFARRYLAERFPALRDAPLVASEVCQYENTSSGDFLVDRHPDFDNVWLVGGGSGHGFKHGPALGEHVAACVEGAAPDPRFSLATKAEVQRRAVF